MSAYPTFGTGNAKLGKHVATFSLPAGYTCPGAKTCHAYANRHTGQITDGKHAIVRCFSATTEAMFPAVRESRWGNLEAVKAALDVSIAHAADVIRARIPKKATYVRIHVAGDFFSRDYFKAWTTIARLEPMRVFYAYTKSVAFLPAKDRLPKNFRVVVSAGGKHADETARAKGYSIASIVMDTNGALPIDHDDSHAMQADHDFSLLLHGTQPKGSDAARALAALKADGFTGYSARRGA